MTFHLGYICTWSPTWFVNRISVPSVTVVQVLRIAEPWELYEQVTSHLG